MTQQEIRYRRLNSRVWQLLCGGYIIGGISTFNARPLHCSAMSGWGLSPWKPLSSPFKTRWERVRAEPSFTYNVLCDLRLPLRTLRSWLLDCKSAIFSFVIVVLQFLEFHKHRHQLSCFYPSVDVELVWGCTSFFCIAFPTLHFVKSRIRTLRFLSPADCLVHLGAKSLLLNVRLALPATSYSMRIVSIDQQLNKSIDFLFSTDRRRERRLVPPVIVLVIISWQWNVSLVSVIVSSLII